MPPPQTYRLVLSQSTTPGPISMPAISLNTNVSMKDVSVSTGRPLPCLVPSKRPSKRKTVLPKQPLLPLHRVGTHFLDRPALEDGEPEDGDRVSA